MMISCILTKFKAFFYSNLYFLGLMFFGFSAVAQEKVMSIKVHDPAIIQQDSVYYIFATGKGISKWRSVDLVNWKPEKPVFEEAPAWAVATIPGFKDHIWAPDISFYEGTYYLYYSISTFGKNKSAIGLATNATLNENDSNYKWIDYGSIIESEPGKTNWNAIDPNLVVAKNGMAYLAFGSFWGGLQLVKLSKDRLKIDETITAIAIIASRKAKATNAGGNPIEAPFIYQKGKYFYLFASIDYCCKGEKSTYKVIFGRAKKATGPFLDKQGQNLATGGGTVMLQGNESWYGVGHCAVANLNKEDYIVFHGYDTTDKGISKLLIRKINWTEEWPLVVL